MSLHDKIVDILAPSVGKFMAESMVKKQCDKLGVKPAELTVSALPSLAEAVQTGLKIFVGSDKATEIARRIAAL